MSSLRGALDGQRILVTNSVCANVGDAALMTALREALMELGASVEVETSMAPVIAERYPGVHFHAAVLGDPAFTKLRGRPRRWAFIYRHVCAPDSLYRRYDMIVSAPGGYVNSFYGFEEKLFVLLLCKKILKKPVGIYAQSVGPLSRLDRLRLRLFMKYIDVIMVRDRFSLNVVRPLASSAKIIAANDAAFLLRSNRGRDSDSDWRIGISVRSWAHDGRSREKYIHLVLALAGRALERGFSVEFVSTCQGVAGYIDDSKLAHEIAQRIAEPFQSRIAVDREGRNVEAFAAKMRSFDCVIGTRLHMCLLSMLHGVPAFNISYEVKGKECYALMGLREWSIDYNEHPRSAAETFDRFLDKKEEIRSHLIREVPRQQMCAREAFSRFFQVLRDRRTRRTQGTDALEGPDDQLKGAVHPSAHDGRTAVRAALETGEPSRSS